MSGFGADWSHGCGRGCEYACVLHVPFSSAHTKVAMCHTAKEDMDAVTMETPHPCLKICAGSARHGSMSVLFGQAVAKYRYRWKAARA